ncbi:hypothetical protein [Silvimonas soli]|uniref:hypothetical protein n=1 Tax=Silvimonas soli TaxID=2980100 RepID=UPI0024B3C551|nr:hypothetical protein [Silvimonas soli]
MTEVTQTHEEKETLVVDVLLPGHEPRVTTPLFLHTKKLLIERVGGRCWICGRTAEESGHPLEAHHHPVERSLANLTDWDLFRSECEAGMWGEYAKAFDWSKFDPADPYTFVDDMTVNGMLLCKEHHTGKGTGIHDLPGPLWLGQKYGREGYQFTGNEVLHHEG